MSGHKKILSELNSSFSEVFGQDFTDAVAKDRKVAFQMKQTANEGKNFSQYIENFRIITKQLQIVVLAEKQGQGQRPSR